MKNEGRGWTLVGPGYLVPGGSHGFVDELVVAVALVFGWVVIFEKLADLKKIDKITLTQKSE